MRSANVVGRDSVVGIAIAGGCTVRGSKSSGDKGFSPPFLIHPDRRILYKGQRGFSPRVKAARFGVGHSPPSNDEVTKGRSYSFTFLVYLHDTLGETFTFKTN